MDCDDLFLARLPFLGRGPVGSSMSTSSRSPAAPSAAAPAADAPQPAAPHQSAEAPQPVDNAAWKRIVAEYQKPDARRASWQLLNTIGPYAALWVLMYFSVGVSWWLTVPLAILAGGLTVRIFIIFHDCGHGSFFNSRAANDVWGFVAGLLTLTPYYHWRWEHSLHHATSGNLDRRGIGDVWTLTVQEYLESSRLRRVAYRLARNPIVLFVIAPIFLFLVWQRIPTKIASAREKRSVWWMNLAVLLMAAALAWTFGLGPYLLIQLIVLVVAGSAGVWLFYIQHQFDDVYWARDGDWAYSEAALKGSSFYKLPRIMQWFSGNIGFHHIHHLSPRIPNYNLERCHRSDPMFKQVSTVTLWRSLNSLRLRLWDESTRKLVGYRQLATVRARHAGARHDGPAYRDSTGPREQH
jgi:omega-6 fatty acid desaturase (delta-12 desaturase)